MVTIRGKESSWGDGRWQIVPEAASALMCFTLSVGRVHAGIWTIYRHGLGKMMCACFRFEINFSENCSRISGNKTGGNFSHTAMSFVQLRIVSAWWIRDTDSVQVTILNTVQCNRRFLLVVVLCHHKFKFCCTLCLSFFSDKMLYLLAPSTLLGRHWSRGTIFLHNALVDCLKGLSVYWSIMYQVGYKTLLRQSLYVAVGWECIWWDKKPFPSNYSTV